MSRWCLNTSGTTESLGTWKKFSIDGVDIKMFDQDDFGGTYGGRGYFFPDKPSILPAYGVLNEAQFRYYLECIENISQQIYMYDIMYQLYQAGVCGQTLNLYDEDGNVVGYFKCGFYDSSDVMTSDSLAIIYTTAYYSQHQQTGEFSFTDYPAENPPAWAEACYRYKIIGPSTFTSGATHFRIDIHRNDITTQDLNIVIGDSSYNEFPCWDIHFVNMYSDTTYVYNNSTHFRHYGSSTILTYHHGTNENYICAGTVDSFNVATTTYEYSNLYDYNIYPTSHYHFKATGIAFIEVIPQEDEYVNELNNRFSPRFQSNMTGFYVIPVYGTQSPEVSGIMDVAKGLMETDIFDHCSQMFNAGNECILALRWYYGLHDAIEVNKSGSLCDICVGGTKITHGYIDPQTLVEHTVYEHAYPMLSEFALWTTSEMRVDPHFDNYLDMCSSYKLFLPYYGFLDIDPNDIVGGTIKVEYNINLLTGQAMITIVCKNARTGNAATKYYSVSCTVGEEVPYGTDAVKSLGLIAAETIGKAAQFAVSVGTGLAQTQAAMTVSQGTKLLANNTEGVSEDLINKAQSKVNAAQNVYNETGIAQKVMGNIQMPQISIPTRSNGAAGDTGSLDELFPYLLITRPIYAGPSNYEDYVGLPSYASANLNAVSGFTQIAAVKPESLTNAPKYVNEIISLLQSGVYL